MWTPDRRAARWHCRYCALLCQGVSIRQLFFIFWLISTRYLTHRQSGPLIDCAIAHRSLAFACISYLNTKIDFIPGEHSSLEPDTLDCLLLEGFSGLDDYAAQFWTDHVLAYLKLTPVDARCVETTNELRIFAAAWKNSRAVPRGRERASQYIDNVSLQDTHPAIREMIEEVILFWRRLKLYEGTSNHYDCEIYSWSGCHITEICL